MRDQLKKKRDQGGFTLIELLIVIVILAILAAIVVFAVGATGKNASAASCESDAKSVQTAVEAYHAQMAAYPAADAWTSLTKAQTDPNGQPVGPWLKSQPPATHYAINFDGSGNVSADAAKTAAYTAADDISGTGGATTPCDANAA